MESDTAIADVVAAVREAFLAQVERHVRSIEHVAAGILGASDRAGRVDLVVRVAHTLKGTAGSIGLLGIGRAAGVVESVVRAPQVSQVRLAAAVARLARETQRALQARCSPHSPTTC